MGSEADPLPPCYPESPSNEEVVDLSVAPSVSSSVLTDIEVDAQGRLDVSNRDLTKLPKLLHQSEASVKSLIVAGNCLKSFDGIRRFTGCEEIDASDNKICSIGALLCVKETLSTLNVRKNEISHCEQLSAFHALVNLDLSHNKIEQLPTVHSLPNLRYLNISSNMLRELPSLRQLENLVELDLNSNQIETLKNANKCFPEGLQRLEIGTNKISDLTELSYLSVFTLLSSLTFEGNSAVAIEGRSFCYRPYLCSCLPETLKVVDGFVLNDMEIVKGEWLCTQGRSRQFKPGTQSHRALCQYLEKVLIPSTNGVDPLQSPLEDKLVKIIQQRRKHEEQLANMPTSAPASPFIDFSRSMPTTPIRRLSTLSDASDSTVVVSTIHESVFSNKGNHMPVPIISSRSKDQSVTTTPSRTPLRPKFSATRPSILSISRTPTPTSSRFSSSQSRPTSATSSVGNLRTSTVLTNRSVSSQSRASSARFLPKQGEPRSRNVVAPLNLKSPGLKKDMAAGPKPEARPKPEDKSTAPLPKRNPDTIPPLIPQTIRTSSAIRIQRWWRKTLQTKKMLNFRMDVRWRLIGKRQRLLERDVKALVEENRQLTQINEEKTAVLADLVLQFKNMENEMKRGMEVLREEKAKEVGELKAAIGSLKKQLVDMNTPRPSALRFARQDGKTFLTWENVRGSQEEDIKHYNVYTNGQLCGSAKALNRRIILTDTQPGDKIRIEAVCRSGRSTMSSPLTCGPNHSKENVP
ncbi:hypothetical protein QR680_009456 [Steinernema hermaphroditum]|uniref:Uncharacterized protein n=1 Tax=Steinernema hermaphroditum TaxID=289476 RepID=A0AA39IKC2_9BILA|nr:hypothetical protein QR680_009456 [Steinernema hermaphroditum]